MLDDVIAQLRAAADQLDNAAVTALRAKADTEEARARLAEAGRGTGHPEILGAITDSQTAGDKAGKVGRLIGEAAEHLSAYMNTIAPGSVQARKTTESAMPSGEALVAESVDRQSRRRNVSAFLGTMARNADDLQEKTQKTVGAAREGVRMIRDPHGPTGSQQAQTTTPSIQAPPQQSTIDVPEAAGHLIIVGLVAGIALHRSYQSIRKGMSRLRTRERTDRAGRSDSRDGSA